jgi:hypothetical protein
MLLQAAEKDVRLLCWTKPGLVLVEKEAIQVQRCTLQVGAELDLFLQALADSAQHAPMR